MWATKSHMLLETPTSSTGRHDAVLPARHASSTAMQSLLVWKIRRIIRILRLADVGAAPKIAPNQPQVLAPTSDAPTSAPHLWHERSSALMKSINSQPWLLQYKSGALALDVPVTA
jgi:hypothetical protein